MFRCIQLAKLAAGNVAPNPMVGAVMVSDGRIIGEGYHMKFGEPHAEVNCINDVDPLNHHLISSSTLYVSLEPCSHHGKTPPCANLIIKNNIPKVVIGCRDPFKEVNGNGIQKLLEAGIEVVENVLERECRDFNKRFFTYHIQQRPYIILKWAQSIDNKIAGTNFEKISISNDITNRQVHKWRSEEASILVGANTALHDNPSLTNRLWKGNNPVRLVIDPNLRLPLTLEIFDRKVKTIVFNCSVNRDEPNLMHIKLDQHSFLPSLLHHLYSLHIQSVLIEGGAKLLQSFIDAGLWDEVRIIVNTELTIGSGKQAPVLTDFSQVKQERYLADIITYYKKL